VLKYLKSHLEGCITKSSRKPMLTRNLENYPYEGVDYELIGKLKDNLFK
jgi:hypothetical protein